MAAHYFGTVENNVTGRPVSGASVWVLTGPSAEGGTAVTLFSDESVTEVSNPVTTNSYGFYEFYVADGHYTLEYAYNGEVRAVIEDVEIAESGSGDLGALELRMDAAEIVTTNAIVASAATLADPDADRIMFWDDSAGSVEWLEVGSGLSLTGTTLTASGLAGTGDITASGLTMNTDRILGRTTASSGAVEELTVGTGLTLSSGSLTANASAIKPTESLVIACSDETTALTAGTAKVTFRMPYAFTLSDVRASVTTAPTGSVLTVDINESGTTILSTKLTIDATEKTSRTAATPAVISDTSLADDAEMTIDIDGVGSTIAGAGLKVVLIGTRT